MEEQMIGFLHQLRLTDVVIILGIGWLIFSGTAARLLRKTKKAKIGVSGVEYEAADDMSGEIRRIDGRAAECQEHIAQKFDTIYKEMTSDRENFARVIDKIEKKIDDGNKVIAEVSLGQKKLTFYTDAVPDAQQLAAGLEYVAAGGNGDCKKDVAFYANERKDMYDAICTVNPSLRILDDVMRNIG